MKEGTRRQSFSLSEFDYTRQPGWSPRGGARDIASLGSGDDKQVTQAIRELDEDVAVAARGLPGDRGVIGEDLHSGVGERLVSAGVTQVDLQSHFCTRTQKSCYNSTHRTWSCDNMTQ